MTIRSCTKHLFAWHETKTETNKKTARSGNAVILTEHQSDASWDSPVKMALISNSEGGAGLEWCYFIMSFSRINCSYKIKLWSESTLFAPACFRVGMVPSAMYLQDILLES